ncbi:MAG: sugar phosphate isomerase/epimerase [Opitutales bacterium]|nr:sugar phosphate isomerase/epimerase [Opitutales bacterium]
MNRRNFLGAAAAAGVLSATTALHGAARRAAPAAEASAPPRYRIGVCDWMILRRQHVGAFSRAREIGADGVELDMGGLGDRETFNSKLIDPLERRRFLDAAAENVMEICSIAMSGFYGQSFAERDGVVERMARDCINTMNLMGVKVAFLPLGVPSNLAENPHLRPAVVDRLRRIGEMAEAADVVIGIETMLDAAGEVELLEEIGSPALQSYFNFANAVQGGRDISQELEILGRDRICQIHCTDTDGLWLENNPRIDMPAVKATLDAMDWRGWLVMERSRDATQVRDVVGNYRANARYLKSVFQ